MFCLLAAPVLSYVNLLFLLVIQDYIFVLEVVDSCVLPHLKELLQNPPENIGQSISTLLEFPLPEEYHLFVVQWVVDNQQELTSLVYVFFSTHSHE